MQAYQYIASSVKNTPQHTVPYLVSTFTTRFDHLPVQVPASLESAIYLLFEKMQRLCGSVFAYNC